MKIAYILPSLDNKGPIVAALNLVKSLQSHTELIDVYYFNDIKGIDFPVNTFKIGFFSKIDFEQYDVIHSYGALPDLYLAKNKKRITGKIATSMHNYLSKDLDMLYGPFKSFILTKLWMLALRFHYNVVISSTDMKSYYNKLLGDSKNYTVIEYGVAKGAPSSLCSKDDELIRSFKANYTLIGSIGLLIERKGYAQLIHFLSENPTYAVVIIGDGGEFDPLNTLAKKLGVSERFLLLGYKSNSVDYYQYFDLYAMVSYSEGCSLAMIEAMSVGLPLICSDISNHRYFFNDDDVSFFELDNIKSLNRAASAILKNNSFSQNSLNVYSEKFSLPAMAQKHLSFYRDLE